MLFHRAFALSLVTLVLPLGSCVIPIGGAEVGDLRVTWSFDESQRCAEVGVENVTVQLIGQPQGENVGLAFGATAACIEGSMVIPDIVAGTYTMTAVGEGDVAIFNNGKGVEVVVAPNVETQTIANLILANGEVVARIEFQYVFPGNLDCAQADVDQISAQVFDDSNGVVIAGATGDCIAGLMTVEGIRLGEHTLRVEGVDGEGNVRFVGTSALAGLQAGETLRINPVEFTANLSSATASFVFAGADSCAEAGVATVDARLVDGEGRVVDGQNVPCVGGRVTFPPVPVGDYELVLDGINGNGQIVFNANEDITLALPVESLALTTMRPTNSTITVSFTLPAGETCATLGVNNIDLRVQTGAVIVGENIACIQGQTTIVGIPSGNVANLSAEAVAGNVVTLTGALTTPVLVAGRGSGTTNQFTVALAPVRSALTVGWRFQRREMEAGAGINPAFKPDLVTASCVDSDVDTVLIRVSRGATLLAAVETACSAGQATIPDLVIAGGNVTIEAEGLRQQEGDSVFSNFVADSVQAAPIIPLSGVRTTSSLILSPSKAFARVIWTGDCSVARAAAVAIQTDAAGFREGQTVPCSQGNTLISLASIDGNVSISLDGVDGQGAPLNSPTTVNSEVHAGLITFRFAEPQ